MYTSNTDLPVSPVEKTREFARSRWDAGPHEVTWEYRIPWLPPICQVRCKPLIRLAWRRGKTLQRWLWCHFRVYEASVIEGVVWLAGTPTWQGRRVMDGWYWGNIDKVAVSICARFPSHHSQFLPQTWSQHYLNRGHQLWAEGLEGKVNDCIIVGKIII